MLVKLITSDDNFQNLNLADFHSQLLTKAVDLFPSLTEEDLKPYLLRSRATNAYDAVTLLAKSVDVAFKQGGDSCTDTTLIRRELETFMVRKFLYIHALTARVHYIIIIRSLMVKISVLLLEV